MAKCQNCQNLLPRTVDRCPVCGTNLPDLDAPASLAPTAAWNVDAETIQAPQAPALRAPEVRKDPKPGVPSLRTVQAPSVAASPTGEAPQPIESGLSDREVPAASTRVEGNVLLGKSPRHSLIVGGALAAAFTILLAGVIAGASLDPANDLAFVDNVASVDVESQAIDWRRDNDEAFVSLRLNGCGALATVSGVVVDRRTVLVPIASIESDPRPTVSLLDRLYPGTVVGLDRRYGLATIRTKDDLPSSLRWGSSNRVKAGDTVIVGPLSGASEAAVVVEVKYRAGEVSSFSIDTDLLPGDVVTDLGGLLIGIANSDGATISSADVLQKVVSQHVLNPRTVSPICPTSQTETPPTEEGATADETGGD